MWRKTTTNQLNGKKTVGISVQFRIQVHRWCFIHKQPRVWELPRPKGSCWTWDQRHEREQPFCFLPEFTAVDRESLPVNFTLSFMTNMTIATSISQTFRSWVTTFQLRSLMASLSHSLYDMHGLAPHIHVLFWDQRDFQISFSDRDTSRNAWHRHWGSFMVDTGTLSNNMKFPSHEC